MYVHVHVYELSSEFICLFFFPLFVLVKRVCNILTYLFIVRNIIEKNRRYFYVYLDENSFLIYSFICKFLSAVYVSHYYVYRCNVWVMTMIIIIGEYDGLLNDYYEWRFKANAIYACQVYTLLYTLQTTQYSVSTVAFN